MITIKPMTETDLGLFKTWLYMPHVAKWYNDPLDWLEEIEQQNEAFSWIHHYIVVHDSLPIGFCQYYACADSKEPWAGYTAMGGSYSIDYLIGEAEYLGKGFGKKTVLELIKKIKMHSDAKRIVVQPEQGNKASCGVLMSCGFIYDTEKDLFLLAL